METNIIGRKILALQYYAAAERAILARIPSAERRYEKFLELNSFEINRVPLRCVASYLGMRLETFRNFASTYLNYFFTYKFLQIFFHENNRWTFRHNFVFNKNSNIIPLKVKFELILENDEFEPDFYQSAYR